MKVQTNDMKPRARQTASRLMVACLVAVSVTSWGAPQRSAAADDSEDKYKWTKALTKKVLGEIGNKALGMAGDFVAAELLKVLGVSGPSEMELAKQEIIQEIRASQIEGLEGLVNGAMDSFRTAISAPGNMHSALIHAQVMTNADEAINTIDAVITNGVVDKVYRLAMTRNVAAVLAAASRRVMGYPESEAARVLQTQMNQNYRMVGVDAVFQGQSAELLQTKSSLLWARVPDRTKACMKLEQRGGQGPFTGVSCSPRTSIGPTACIYTSENGRTKWEERSDINFPHCWRQIHEAALRTWNSDPVVKAVKATMQELKFQGYNPTGVASAYIIDKCRQAASKPLVDFNGDCKSEPVIWDPGDNSFSYGTYFNATVPGATQHFGHWNDIPVPGDYDGDGASELSIWRFENGQWFAKPVAAPEARFLGTWGTTFDTPVPGDYDGDGRLDVAVWRQGDGYWFVLPANGATAIVVQWGGVGDVPVAGDYDGDSKTDWAVWRPGNGTWYIASSTGPQHTLTWGVAGDVPVPGDYDGDGRTDLAVWRPSNGTWYVWPSTGAPLIIHPWGLSTDVPVTGDYDGDGRTDLVVYRQSTKSWHVTPSNGSSVYITTWGGASSRGFPVNGILHGRFSFWTGTWF